MADTNGNGRNGGRIRLGDWLIIASILGGVLLFALRYENRLTVVETASAGQQSTLQEIRNDLRDLREIILRLRK